MIRKTKQGLSWLEFSLLQNIPGLVHGVFSRLGGASLAPFAGLNVSFDVGDNKEHVEENIQRISDVLQIPRLIFANQTHGDHIALITKDSPSLIENTDGFYTLTQGCGLVVKHADCQAALFFDPQKKILANVHCGWRGNVQNIYAKMIEKFLQLGSDPKDLLVCISPSLGPNHAEFIHYKQEFPEDFHSFQKKSSYFDLWEISKEQLKKEGVLPQNIEIASLCTYENASDFFSYRREKITGRNATVIGLL